MKLVAGERRYIYCRGAQMPTPFPVRTWDDHGLRWTGRSRLRTSVILNHWTAAENPPIQVFENMSAHKGRDGKPEPLSVHFVVDPFGTIFQFADTELRAAHCARPERNSANGWSIGIEYQCRGHDTKVPTRGVTRHKTVARIHGRLISYAELTERQLYVGTLLNQFLSDLYGLPFTVPVDETGAIVQDCLPERELMLYRGSACHFHFEPNKPDCGVGILKAIKERSEEADAAQDRQGKRVE